MTPKPVVSKSNARRLARNLKETLNAVGISCDESTTALLYREIRALYWPNSVKENKNGMD